MDEEDVDLEEEEINQYGGNLSWKCNICHTINNIQLTQTKYHNQCCACNYVYDCNKSNLFSSSTFNICPHHKDIESIGCDKCNEAKLWRCKLCQTTNDFTWYECQKCEEDRSLSYDSSYVYNSLEIQTESNQSTSSTSTWIKLKQCPLQNISKPAHYDNNSLLFAAKVKSTSSNAGNAWDIVSFRLNWLLKYNLDQDQWSRWTHNPYSNQFIMRELRYKPDDLDELSIIVDSKYVYISNSKSSEISFTVHKNTKEWSRCPIKVNPNFCFDHSCFIHDDLHINIHGSHQVWNSKSETFIGLHNISALRWTHTFAFVYIKRLNMTLLFVEMASYMHQHDECDSIWAYYPDKNEWKQRSDAVVPKELKVFGYSLTSDEQYIVIVTQDSDIYLLDLDEMEFKRSNVSGPEDTEELGPVSVISHRNLDTEETIVFGYIRTQWKRKEFSYIMKLPYCLIRIIQKYYKEEYIHLYQSLTGKQWKAPLSSLFAL